MVRGGGKLPRMAGDVRIVAGACGEQEVGTSWGGVGQYLDRDAGQVRCDGVGAVLGGAG